MQHPLLVDFAHGQIGNFLIGSFRVLHRISLVIAFRKRSLNYIYFLDCIACMNDSGSDGSSVDPIRDRFEQGNQETVFRNKRLLDPETIIDADRIVGRDEQLDQTISYLRTMLHGNRAPDLLLHGPSGTGKSLIINSVCDTATELAQAEGINFVTLEISCQKINSYDRAMYNLAKQAAEKAGVDVGVPRKGVSTDRKIDRLFDLVSAHFDAVMVILDEIDLLVGSRQTDAPAYSDVIYQLSRTTQLGLEDSDVTIAALTNDPSFMQELDGRAFSSFNPEQISFPDYDANQLQSILDRRRDAFKDDVLDSGVIRLCSAFGAQDHGDARQAIDLFRKAGEIANYTNEQRVREEHVREAQEEAEREATLSQMQGLSTQKKFALYSVATTKAYASDDIEMVPNTVAYNVYSYITDHLDSNSKSRDSFLRYMKEAETYGFVRSQKQGHNTKGVHKYYLLTNDAKVIMDTLEQDSRLAELEEEAPSIKSVVNAQLREHS